MLKTILKTFFLVLIFFQSIAQKEALTGLDKLPNDDWQFTSSRWKMIENLSIHPFDTKKVKFSDGNSILFAQNGIGTIVSNTKTSDVRLKFDFVLGQNSETIFFIQGRYGINLSNGNIIKSDGNAVLPFQRASKMAGLWQNIDISIDVEEKTGNCIIEKVVMNGLTIHENYVMSQPSKNAPIQNSGTDGSFVFMNQNGVVGIRNFEYAAYTPAKPISMNNLTYEVFETYSWDRQFANKNEKSEKGSSELITHELGIPHQNYLLIYRGNLNAEYEGNYKLTLNYAGKCGLWVNGKEVLDNKGEVYRQPRTIGVDLKKGTNTFEIRYNKIWWRPALGLFVSGKGVKPYPLHSLGSLPEPTPTNSVSVEATNEVEMIRSFMMFEGKKRTKIISVGSPEKVNYSFDLDQGALLYTWKGDFADVTEMWHERGEPQILQPKGLLLKLSGKPIVFQNTETSPDSLDSERVLIYKGYRLDNQGFPSFNYELNGNKISQSYKPENGGLRCEISSANPDFQVKLADGKQIQMIEKGLYLVDNQYIKLDSKLKPLIRKTKNGEELIMKIGLNVSFQILW